MCRDMYGNLVRDVRAQFYGECPNCGCHGLVDHGSGHRECLICGYDSARDSVGEATKRK